MQTGAEANNSVTCRNEAPDSSAILLRTGLTAHTYSPSTGGGKENLKFRLFAAKGRFLRLPGFPETKENKLEAGSILTEQKPSLPQLQSLGV